MEKYRFQEVICPFCKKGFVTRIYDDYDVCVNHEGKTINGWNDFCPKCDSEVFVVENELNGKSLSEYPKAKIKDYWILR